MYFVRYCSEVPVLLHILDTRPFVITKLQIKPLNVFSRDVLPRYRSFRFVWNVRRVHSCAANSVNFISRAKKTILRCLPFWIVAPACSSCAGRFFIILFGLFFPLHCRALFGVVRRNSTWDLFLPRSSHLRELNEPLVREKVAEQRENEIALSLDARDWFWEQVQN